MAKGGRQGLGPTAAERRNVMPSHMRSDDDVVILSNIGRLMNNPRHVDAGRDVGDALEQGYRNFIVELAGVNDTGSSLLGLLMTLTRLVRRAGGEIVLARPTRGVEGYLEEMQLDGYWDVFANVPEAEAFFRRP